jgi:DNA-binding NarL/FixJ family response regulator
MDIRLPDANGLELTRLIKKLNPDIDVVILTNYDMDEYREAAFQIKADHFVSKNDFNSLICIISSRKPGS